MDQEDPPQTGSSQPPPPMPESTAPPAPQPASRSTGGPDHERSATARDADISAEGHGAAARPESPSSPSWPPSAGVFGIFGGLVRSSWAAPQWACSPAARPGSPWVRSSALVLLISSIAYLLFAWGAWGLQPWAWTLGIILAAVQIVLGVFQLFNGNPGSLVSILIAGGITYYLFQPEVKAAFGRT